MTRSAPSSTAQPDLLLVHLPHDGARALADPRGRRPRCCRCCRREVRRPRLQPLARCRSALRFSGSRSSSRPIMPHLLAVAVVGERDHDLGAGAQELAVQLADGVREVEHDLRHVRAALQVAAALELEQVALGAEHDAVVESLEQAPHTVSIAEAGRLCRSRTALRARICRRSARGRARRARHRAPGR